MKRIPIILISALLIPALATGTDASKQPSGDTIQVLKIAGQDQRAVIKTPDGKMQIIKVGDPIGDNAKVVEITTGRVVIEEKKGKESEKVIIRLENGKQHVERLKKAGDPHPQEYAVKTSQAPPAQKPTVQDKQTTQATKEKKDKKDKKENKAKQKKKSKKAEEKKSSDEKAGIENTK
jgi:outer membrane biosynthesis protein TonB